MAMVTVAEMDVLREFARSVLGKAKQHAPGFEHLVLTLTGAVATYHRPGTVKAGKREDHQVNSCWFDLKGVTYFSPTRTTSGASGAADTRDTSTSSSPRRPPARTCSPGSRARTRCRPSRSRWNVGRR